MAPFETIDGAPFEAIDLKHICFIEKAYWNRTIYLVSYNWNKYVQHEYAQINIYIYIVYIYKFPSG